ncbi:hypothetical protein R3W88_014475 [Solanum pinnatisectum]|uniref:Uncharacterized protein n=1 Tax=Solanum pinnatisectum TaxID=50273 RepID=A0AAV9KRV2_9SOLN|nr:hypothetical protein R3W88_014475 [Solanum pinnatisectum]
MLERKKTLVFQFLMKLRHNFEPIKANILNRETLPDINVIFGELICEEMCINTLASMDHHTQLMRLCIHQKIQKEFTPPFALNPKALQKMIKNLVATALPGSIFNALTVA